MKIVICSGGTGGHMFPACALLKAAQRAQHDAIIITDSRGDVFCDDISEKIVFDTIRFSYKNFLKMGYDILSAIGKFIKFWIHERPDITIGFGGIFTVVPLIVSKICGSKIVIYEQNSIIGKANKFLSRFADLKLASFDLGNGWIETPAPVRDEFTRNILPYKCENDGIIKILVIGGSQGAASFSHIVPNALMLLSSKDRKNIEIVQQVSQEDYRDCLTQIYKDIGVKSILKGFLYNVAEIMLDSQLVICRSGASTLSELSATGRPAILIPYPNAMDNHQFHNAMYYKNKGAAWILEEKDGVEKELAETLGKFLQNRELLKIASSHMMNRSVSHAADHFVELIRQLA